MKFIDALAHARAYRNCTRPEFESQNVYLERVATTPETHPNVPTDHIIHLRGEDGLSRTLRTEDTVATDWVLTDASAAALPAE